MAIFEQICLNFGWRRSICVCDTLLHFGILQLITKVLEIALCISLTLSENIVEMWIIAFEYFNDINHDSTTK